MGNLGYRRRNIAVGVKKLLLISPKTKRLPSEYQYIEAGLVELWKVIEEKNIKSIAIPHLALVMWFGFE